MFKQIDYTMIVVSDMQRSVEFYRDKLGIPLKFQSPEWTEFATGATTLALHGGGVPSQGPPAGDPSKVAGACSIGFNVDDVDAAFQKAIDLGAKEMMPPQAYPGGRFAIVADPQGASIGLLKQG